VVGRKVFTCGKFSNNLARQNSGRPSFETKLHELQACTPSWGREGEATPVTLPVCTV